MKILVINCGSSSLKYQLRDMDRETVLCSGVVERIGETMGKISHIDQPGTESVKKNVEERTIDDHVQAMRLMVENLLARSISSLDEIDAIGHRVVQGGESFSHPELVDDQVVETIRANIPLAPVHSSNTTGIVEARKIFGDTPNVTVFDTDFHLTMPDYAYMYPLPLQFYEKLKIRKYGFHGTSHKYVSRKAAEYLGKDPSEVNLITIHLGNGCSMDAVLGGKCVDTTMGLTPLAGLMMGTRCGDIDPAILPFLAKHNSMSLDDIDEMMNFQSGLFGISGTGDMRDVHAARAEGDSNAQLAFEMFAYRVKKFIGSFLAVLGTVSALVFTAGIGENDADVRAEACKGLEPLGIRVDPEKNARREPGIREIQTDDSPIKVLIVPTDEEYEIARCTMEVVKQQA
ncbi:acetate/propionate family kinase [Pseudodesulfovibrio sp.]|uniref:acetate/propionate family kinase n=1 Tax=unclassified Pseudodesulfovibrio TaxID=2661612 RepID=UPI003AFF7D3C